MRLELIFFFIILASVIISFLLSARKKEEKEEEEKKEEKEYKKPQPSAKEEITRKEKIAMAMKISLAGAIFLILLYALVPEFIVKYHKEIIILVVAMIAGAALLGIPQEWEKSSTRKILKAHFVILSIILVLAVLYKDQETGKWLESFKPSVQSQATAAITDYPLCAGPHTYDLRKQRMIKIKIYPNCWSGKIMMLVNSAAQVDTFSTFPADLEYKLGNGDRVLVPNNSVCPDLDNPKCPKSIITESFRLRGAEEALVTIVNQVNY